MFEQLTSDSTTNNEQSTGSNEQWVKSFARYRFKFKLDQVLGIFLLSLTVLTKLRVPKYSVLLDSQKGVAFHRYYNRKLFLCPPQK